MKRVITYLFLGMLIVGARTITAQWNPTTGMINPAIDKKEEPFSYPSAPTDQLALPGAQLGTEITPEGYLYTGYGELMFLVGYPSEPVSQRIRTLERGYLPIFHYTYRDDTVRYDVTTITYPLQDGEPERDPVNLVRVVATNDGETQRTSYFSVAFRYSGSVNEPSGVADHRFPRPALATKLGDYSQPGVKFDRHWVYGFSGEYATRSGDVVYEFPSDPKPTLWLTRTRLSGIPGGVLFGTSGHAGVSASAPLSSFKPERADVLPDTPVLLAQYELHLPPRGSRTLVFKMPVQPIELRDSDKLSKLQAINFPKALQETADNWERILSRGIQIRLPEKKVADTFKANLISNMLDVIHVGNDYNQSGGKLQFNGGFWLRDDSFAVDAYDVTGHFNIAKKCLNFFLKFQQPDGLFISQPDQFDGWGQALWAFGRYYQFTQDTAFAKTVYPSVQRAVKWLQDARGKDPLHLMPAAFPGDDEFTNIETRIKAHITGANLRALGGLRGAIVLAKAVGTQADVREFEQEYDDYHRVLIDKLREISSKNGDYIPPGIDIQGGQDWGNMDTLFPEILLPPFDPMVTSTLRHVRAKYGEGVMTYAGGRLQLYLTMKNIETEVVRGEQEQVVRDLYAILVHTSSTHAGWEEGYWPWTTRDFGEDLAPHLRFSAEYMLLVRNMLLREDGNKLHLLSALSPAWCNAGDVIEVDNAPTYFGRLGMKATFSSSGMNLTLNANFRSQPAEIVVDLPWFESPTEATADGKPLRVTNHRLVVPSTTRQITVQWARHEVRPALSYSKAVDQFIKEYRSRYKRFRQEGASEPKPPILD